MDNDIPTKETTDEPALDKPSEEKKSNVVDLDSKRTRPEQPVSVYFIVLLVLIHLFITSPSFQNVNMGYLMFGAYKVKAIQSGDWYRLLTANLVHFNWSHLASNCMWIFIFGQLLEPLINRKRMVTLLFMLALGSTLLKFIFFPELQAISAGASGIGFGLMGCYLTLLITNLLMQKSPDLKQQFFIAFCWVVGMFAYDQFFRSGIDLVAHLCGLATGISYGLYLYLSRPKKLQKH